MAPEDCKLCSSRYACYILGEPFERIWASIAGEVIVVDVLDRLKRTSVSRTVTDV